MLGNLKLVEILSKSTKAAKITILYRINCNVLKGFPALEAEILVLFFIRNRKLSIFCEHIVAIVFFVVVIVFFVVVIVFLM